MRALLRYQMLFQPLPGCKLHLPPKNVGMQALFMTSLGACGQMHITNITTLLHLTPIAGHYIEVFLQLLFLS